MIRVRLEQRHRAWGEVGRGCQKNTGPPSKGTMTFAQSTCCGCRSGTRRLPNVCQGQGCESPVGRRELHGQMWATRPGLLFPSMLSPPSPVPACCSASMEVSPPLSRLGFPRALHPRSALSPTPEPSATSHESQAGPPLLTPKVYSGRGYPPAPGAQIDDYLTTSEQ